ncbi:MAG: Fic family protein [Candidatus Methanomethylophilaceae archaeon]|nr:Fic family protein [Candidatus Methanomethylophilaceae archaeon]
MRIPERSPPVSEITESESVSISPDILRYAKEFNSRYLHWDDLRYRDLGGHDRSEIWRIMKILRVLTYHHVRIADYEASYSLVDDYVRDALHEMDVRLFSGPVSSAASGNKRDAMLSVSSSMEESIASSQLEGASTTTVLAKRLLREGKPPKDRSERMIVNNYAAMQLIRERIGEPLTPGLIKEIHRTVTDGLMDDPSTSGEFRKDDSVAVRGIFEDVTYHVPAGYERIDEMMDALCRYANDDRERGHPVIKGIILHYLLAYIHPFLDGNGRVSRALFYWYCLRYGYPMMAYLSVSKAIKEHRQAYSRAFLHSETDGDDITYFIRFNLKMILESLDAFESYLSRKAEEQSETEDSFAGYGLSTRQLQILRDLIDSGAPMSQYELSEKYQTPVPTIRRDLMRLIDAGLVKPANKDGHRQLYVYSGLH